MLSPHLSLNMGLAASLSAEVVRAPAIPVSLEFLIRAIPAVLFLVLAFIRFKKIRSIGFVKTLVYSKFFIYKKSLQYLQALIELAMVLFFVSGRAYTSGV